MDTDNNINRFSIEDGLNAIADTLRQQAVSARENFVNSYINNTGTALNAPESNSGNTNVILPTNTQAVETDVYNLDDLESVLADNNESRDEVAEILVDPIPAIDDRLVEELMNMQESTEEPSTTEPTLEIKTLNVESVDSTTIRFSGASWFKYFENKNIILAGLGGIGSYVAYLLSKFKPAYLILYDPDKVEFVNLSGQLYSSKDVGNYKSAAICSKIEAYSGYSRYIECREKFSPTTTPMDIMICGFDNMGARKVFFKSWCQHLKDLDDEAKKKCLFIDGRLAAEEFQIFAITGDNDYAINEYKDKYLFSDDEADATVCSYKQTAFCACMIASYMVNLLANFAALMSGDNFRTLPFKTSYDATIMLFKTES